MLLLGSVPGYKQATNQGRQSKARQHRDYLYAVIIIGIS